MKSTPERLYSYQNIVDGQGMDIAITGMSIVFTALALISLFIAMLPRILALWSPEPPAVAYSPAGPDGPLADDDEVVAAIGIALHTGMEK